MNKSKKEYLLKGIGLFLILIALWGISYFIFRNIQLQEFQNFIRSFGIFGPIIFILLQFIEVIIVPVPGYFFGVSSGALFGFFGGFLLMTIGTMLAHSAVFLLSKRYGRPLVMKLLSKKSFSENHYLVNIISTHLVFVSRLIFFFPSDIITILAGLTNMRFRSFFIATFFGFLPYLIFMPYIGSSAIRGQLNIFILIFVSLILFALSVFLTEKNRRELKKNVKKKK